jgi:hypothetical protein
VNNADPTSLQVPLASSVPGGIGTEVAGGFCMYGFIGDACGLPAAGVGADVAEGLLAAIANTTTVEPSVGTASAAAGIPRPGPANLALLHRWE